LKKYFAYNTNRQPMSKHGIRITINIHCKTTQFWSKWN